MTAQLRPEDHPSRQATYSVREAAEKLGVSEKTVRRMIKSGQLRADMQRGRRGDEYRIDGESLDKADGEARQPARVSVTTHQDQVPGEIYRQVVKELEYKAQEIGALRRAVEHELPALLSQRDAERKEKERLSMDLAEARTAKALLEVKVSDLAKVAEQFEQTKSEKERLQGQRIVLLVAIILLLFAGAGLVLWRLLWQ